MQVFNDVKAISDRISKIRRLPGAFSNCYFDVNTLNRFAASGLTYYEEIPGGILVFIDRETRLSLHACFVPDAPFTIHQCNKPVFLEIVFLRDDDISQGEKMLINAGLKVHDILVEFLIGTPSERVFQQRTQELEEAQSKGYRFMSLSEDDVVPVYEMLLHQFGPYILPGITQIDWKSIIEKKEGVCAKTPQGELCAVCLLPSAFRGALGVVSPHMRGKGLGKNILFYAFHVARDASNQHMWISINNAVNLSIMKKMGAKDTGRRARQYALTHN